MKVGSCERDEKRLSEGRSVAEESACCVSVRARQREEVGRAKGHRDGRLDTRSRHEAVEMTSRWMMDESSTLLHIRKEKSVCCVCVCVRDRERTSGVGAHDALVSCV